mgnify:CR=1 FL=1
MIDFDKPIRGKKVNQSGIKVIWSSEDSVFFTYSREGRDYGVHLSPEAFNENYENVPEEPVSYYLAVDKAALDKHIKSMTDDRWHIPVSTTLIKINDDTAELFNECPTVSSIYVKVYPYENPSSDN